MSTNKDLQTLLLTNKTKQNVENIIQVEFCIVPMKSLVFLDHFFIIIQDKEYHLGGYEKGKFLDRGTTTGYTVYSTKLICSQCFDYFKLNLKYEEDYRLFNHYPIINCESLNLGYSINTLLISTSVFTIAASIIYRNFNYLSLVLLVIFIFHCIYRYFLYTFKTKNYCLHLQ